jgi:hypothetical protein
MPPYQTVNYIIYHGELEWAISSIHQMDLYWLH